jgi:hypothetical protein
MIRVKMETDFVDQLLLDPFDVLDQAERLPCPGCKIMKKYYCCDCVRLVGLERVPQVALPIRCSIVLCNKESRKKSSIIPVPLIAPDSEIFSVSYNSIPTFAEGSVLVFPGPAARTLEELTDTELTSISNAVFIDSTWRQTAAMLRSSLSTLPQLKLATHKTLFWRYQQECDTCLATIEAIYYFYADLVKEKHRRGLGPEYGGELDNLLWFFLHNYKTIQADYTARRHKDKQFRYIPGYIKPKS